MESMNDNKSLANTGPYVYSCTFSSPVFRGQMMTDGVRWVSVGQGGQILCCSSVPVSYDNNIVPS